MLAAKKILSAPVVACSEGDAPDDCTDVIGFVDIRDVLVNFLSGKHSHRLASPAYNFQSTACCSGTVGLNLNELKSQPMLQQMHQLEEAGRSFAKKKLSDISELGAHQLCNPSQRELTSSC